MKKNKSTKQAAKKLDKLEKNADKELRKVQERENLIRTGRLSALQELRQLIVAKIVIDADVIDRMIADSATTVEAVS
jgi:hypothetical protein